MLLEQILQKADRLILYKVSETGTYMAELYVKYSNKSELVFITASGSTQEQLFTTLLIYITQQEIYHT